MSRSRRAVALALVLGTLMIAGADLASGQSTPVVPTYTNPNRVSYYDLTFTDFGQFLDAMAAYSFIQDVSSAPGDAANLPGNTLTVKSLHPGLFTSTTGNVTVTRTPISPTLYATPMSSPGGPGTITHGYNTPIAATFGESWIVAGINNGRYTLDFLGGGSGSAWGTQISNLPFRMVLTINGNWSEFGTGFGQVEWLGINPGYTVNEFFTHSNGVTTLDLSSSNWNTTSPNASFRLYGDLVDPVNVVPEPASMVLMATGLIGLGAMARIRRRKEREARG